MRYTIRFYDQKEPDRWEFSLSGFPNEDPLVTINKTLSDEHITYVSYETDTEYRYKQAVFSTSYNTLDKDRIAIDIEIEPTSELLTIYLIKRSNGLHVGTAEYLNRRTREKKHVKFIEFYTRVQREDNISIQEQKPQKSVQFI